MIWYHHNHCLADISQLVVRLVVLTTDSTIGILANSSKRLSFHSAWVVSSQTHCFIQTWAKLVSFNKILVNLTFYKNTNELTKIWWEIRVWAVVCPLHQGSLKVRRVLGKTLFTLPPCSYKVYNKPWKSISVTKDRNRTKRKGKRRVRSQTLQPCGGANHSRKCQNKKTHLCG